jgi:hypothetical protein
MTFGLEFFDLTPSLRLSGDSIAFVRKFTKVGGTGSGRNGLEVGLVDDAELKLLEGSAVDGYIAVTDRDAAYTAIIANGMVELQAGQFALATDAISRIQNISATVLELGIAGSQPRLRFERKAVDGIQRVNDTLYQMPAASFDALVTAAATYQSTVKERITEVIAAYMAADAAIIDGVDFTGKITAPVEGNIVPFYFANQAAFPAAADAHGAVAHSHADGALFFAHGGMWHQLALEADLLTSVASVAAEAATRAAADTALSGRLDVLETDPTTATAVAAGDAATLSSANSYTDTSITNLVNGADAALDTLKEIGDALAQGDTDVTAALTAQITTEATTRAAADTALSGRLDTLEVDPVTKTYVDTADATKLDASAVSGYGATLIDDADAAAARATLGLGTAATTAAGDYATAAQGALADTAVQPAAISNVDNTSDADKPVSTAQQAALDLKANKAGDTFTGDVIIDEGSGSTIKLETTGATSAGIHIEGPSGSMGYLDTTNGFGNDSLQVYSANFWVRAINGGTGNVIIDGNLTLGGTALTATFTELNQLDGVTLGTAASAATGDFATAAQGALADTAVQPAAISNIDNTSDADKPVSTAQQAALDLRALLDGTNIPGPYANDGAAAIGGVAVGAIYKHSPSGAIHWRVA